MSKYSYDYDQVQDSEYIVIVTGPSFAGKSTLTKTITKRDGWSMFEFPVENEHLVFYGGKLHLGADTITFLSTPGCRRRFDFMWSFLSEKKVIGYIIMIDSYRPEMFREARSIMETFRAYSSVPNIVVANKQDDPESVSVNQLRHELKVPDNIPIVPCVAMEYESVKQVVITLLEQVLAALESESSDP